jgi:hypothetical protein
MQSSEGSAREAAPARRIPEGDSSVSKCPIWLRIQLGNTIDQT